MKIKTVLFALLFVALLAGNASAQGLTVDIHGPGQRKVNLVMLPPRGLSAAAVPGMAAQLKLAEPLLSPSTNPRCAHISFGPNLIFIFLARA